MSVAVIGCGYWGKNLVRNFFELDALKAVCDADFKQAEKFAKEYSVEAMSIEEILSSEIQAIVIAAPAPMHAEIALKAFEVGKHVFVEKPLAMNIEEADLMIEASKKSDCHLMVGHLLQYHPIFSRLRKIVADGDIGNLSYIYSNRLSLGKIRAEEDVIWSFAPHDLSMILSLANDSVVSVSSYKSEILQDGIADSGMICLEFSKGLKSHIYCSWLNPVKEQKLVVIGEEGMAVFDDTKSWDEKLVLYDHLIDVSQTPPLPEKAEARKIEVPYGEPLKQECKYFLDVISGKEEPLTDGIEGRAVLDVLERASSY